MATKLSGEQFSSKKTFGNDMTSKKKSLILFFNYCHIMKNVYKKSQAKEMSQIYKISLFGALKSVMQCFGLLLHTKVSISNTKVSIT